MQIVIDARGTIHTLYDEAFDLRRLGPAVITRASHIEPDADGQWWAEIINGPRLGPFERRSQALATEVEWLMAQGLQATAARNCGQSTPG
ncbi:hypothetical protein Pan44_39170 [Caulifigura coniformis]|uniref:Uncharacterized protein n=1 Tax=Caulifigura coniformis TaxID=2527983 RepID=A0A517SIC5_9PLAN|nr:hypothetical protein [Caulifigura coniformis]QDT55869.1 hypothetical protein Pan44_39170 [Caulifigura coniformis]